MKRITVIALCICSVLMLSSCNTWKHSIKSPSNYVELYSGDFEFSGPVTGEATITQVLCIDWEHLFGDSKTGEISTPSSFSLPIIGDVVLPSGVNYALYDLLQKNPGYDVIFYPQVETYKHAPILGSNLYSVTTYKVTARLGKLKKK